MQVTDFDYHLPEELIAHYPAAQRTASRLLCLDTVSGHIQHRQFRELTEFLREGDLLVFNDTRVIPARLYAYKESGGRIEILIERLRAGNRALAQIRASKSPKPGTRLRLLAKDEGSSLQPYWLEVLGREGDFFLIQFPPGDDMAGQLQRFGHIPLPPYIKRQDETLDAERYQTVYAREDGAVAAPTAGLHFDEALLQALAAKGVEQAFITLHVGAGTFQPVRVKDVISHRMHKEWVKVDVSVCDKIAAVKRQGGRVIAIGTTTVRSLEAAALGGALQPFQGETDIFIYPGFRFNVVDAMVTNFHLPQSTLLMLVSAFCDKEMLLGAYEEAVKQQYRFFSYGDAMFLYRHTI